MLTDWCEAVCIHILLVARGVSLALPRVRTSDRKVRMSRCISPAAVHVTTHEDGTSGLRARQAERIVTFAFADLFCYSYANM